jgi:ribosome-associated protein
MGVKPTVVEGLRNARWVAMDYSDVLVHIFVPEDRTFYNLENLWADARLNLIPNLE